MAIPFVGQRFHPEGFADYLRGVSFSGFTPEFATLHHTASPSLAMRPSGLSDQHLRNLLSYYQGLGWSGAPHLFVDDRPDGIIVFQRMDRRGVHAVSFNARSWGVEMLGDYDSEPFHTGRGAAVRDNTMRALAAMCKRLGVSAETIRFHRDDPKTSKSCPGRLVSKADVVQRVAQAMGQAPPPDASPSEPRKEWEVALPDGRPFSPVHVQESRPIVPVRAFLRALGVEGSLRLEANRAAVLWTPPGSADVKRIPVAEFDNAGSAWALVRLLAEAAGRRIEVAGDVVRLV